MTEIRCSVKRQLQTKCDREPIQTTLETCKNSLRTTIRCTELSINANLIQILVKLLINKLLCIFEDQVESIQSQLEHLVTEENHHLKEPTPTVSSTAVNDESRAPSTSTWNVNTRTLQ